MLLVGTSGWSYQDWIGPVYPIELAQRPGTWLEEYAQHFRTVEINSTFYRLPPERTVEGWVEKGRRIAAWGGSDAEVAGAQAPPQAFEFSVKAPQDVTHTAMVQGDAQMVEDLLEQFHGEVCEPLGRAGLLGAALLQLSPRFQGGERELQMLELAIRALTERRVDVAVEFRHRTWVENRDLSPAAVDLLTATGAALCAVDGPSFPPLLRDTARHGYVRFHGRRPDVWFARGKERESEDGLPARYDYLYRQDELEPWARVLRDNDQKFEKIRVFFNNHPRGQAVQNGEEMMRMLGVPKPPQAPRTKGPQRKLGDY